MSELQGKFLKVFNTYLVGINQANGFKTHNELTMYPLGNYPLAPSVYRTPATSDEGVVDSSEVLEVMSPQVRVERMGPATVEDLPRYHS